MNNFLEININSIMNNLKIIKSENTNKELCIPVKANAYGLGYDIINYFIKYGYDFFGVSTLEEALYLRSKNSKIRILIFSAIFIEELSIVRDNNIMITVYDFKMLEQLDSEIKFHLKFDVGMGRLGFNEETTLEIIAFLKDKSLVPEGIYTHLPFASNEKISYEQIYKFETIVGDFFEFPIKYIHYANGLACLKYKTKFDNLIRPGLVTYGYFESISLKNKICMDIKSSVSLKTMCSYIKEYEGAIGYGLIDNVCGSILTIPLGYHDGIKQSYHKYNIKNIGKIVGKVCMCQCMILLNDEVSLKPGDKFYIFQNDEIYNLSEYSKVSVYEILATLGNRIKRIYIEE